MAEEFLACPKCKGGLAYKSSGDKEILVCFNCGVFYGVENGIPLLLIEQAEKIQGAGLNLEDFHD